MTPIRTLRRLAVWTAALALAGCAASQAPGSARSDALPTHPLVKNDRDTCQGCHEGSHPEVVEAWSAGPHGLNLVQCYGCHGSTDQNFIPEPNAGRCDGCHATMVASVTDERRGTQSCFTCHDPHHLGAKGRNNPHPANGVTR